MVPEWREDSGEKTENEAILGRSYGWETHWIEIGNPADLADWETTETIIGQGIEEILDKTKRLDHDWIQPRILIEFIVE